MADALVGQIGSQWGLRLLGGTGGESGAAVEGLRKVYYNPEIFGVLPLNTDIHRLERKLLLLFSYLLLRL